MCEKLINLVSEKEPKWNVESKSKNLKIHVCILLYSFDEFKQKSNVV
jgi:hypothetical protein